MEKQRLLPPPPAAFTPTALASTDNSRCYDFGDVRAATLTLLTVTALSG